jgi:hypothetical protein
MAFDSSVAEQAVNALEGNEPAEQAPAPEAVPDQPEQQQQQEAAPAEGKVSETPSEEQITDLDSLERFRFGGREMTPKDLQAAVLMQSDYTRKTQALAEERKALESETKYYENLNYDLNEVRNDPSLVEAFKKVYPEKFHAYLDMYGIGKGGAQQTQEDGTRQGHDPVLYQRVQELNDNFNALQQEKEEAAIQASEQYLESLYSELGQKYPNADPNVITLQAQRYMEDLRAKGDERDLSKEEFEQLFQASDTAFIERAKAYQSSLVQAQRQANMAGRDVKAGGAIPGTPPQKARTISEASAQLRNDPNFMNM